MPLRQTCRTIFSLLFLATINPGIAQAQVIPDKTLTRPTVVNELQNMRKITDGEKVGTNLFHSFKEFSIPEGMEVIFENGLDVENIFTRVTGTEASFIDGLLKTSGGANFFLVNPNGIVFGKNAQLDIGGSFIATTADQVEFADGIVFSARGTEKPLLTLKAPIGLGLNGNNGSITVNGSGNQITNDSTLSPIEFGQTPSGLSVNDGQTLALVGNGINFNSGVVTTQNGNIYLGSFNSGVIGISQAENELNFSNDGLTTFQDINLNQQSLVNSSGEIVGNISLIGKNINLKDGSFIFARNQGNLSAGSINIKASESLNLSGTSPDEISSNIQSEVSNTGQGSDVNISALQLNIQDNGRIQANTFSDGTSGNLKFNAIRNIKLDNSRISSFTFGEGNAGNIQLSTSLLQLISGGTITSSTISTGNGGEITINSDSIEVISNSITSRRNRSNISASSFSNNQDNPGNAGNLTINTRQLEVKGGGSVSSSSFGFGNGGNININASEFVEVSGIDNNTGSRNPESTIRTAVQRRPIGNNDVPAIPSGTAGNLQIKTPILKVTQQGVVTVENQGRGEAGTLTINAETLNIDQAGSINATANSGIGGNIALTIRDLNISNDSQITATANGIENGGNITINTTNLNAKKNSRITASSFEGDGGNMDINANDSISLKDQNEITARSDFGNGGNIEINSDRLQLDNSNISASAGGDGNGGNVNITADSFLALNDSDVTATAIRGNGGNIVIDADALLGIEERLATPENGTSDADASSEFGQNGTVTITNPQGSIQDPVIAFREPEITILEPKFQENCFERKKRLTDSRRDNIPTRPDESSNSYQYTPDTNFVPPQESSEFNPQSLEDLIWREGYPIASGNQIVTTPDGKVLLVVKSQLESLRRRGCLSPEVKVIEELTTPNLNFQSD